MGLSLIDENEEEGFDGSDDIKTIHHREKRVTSFTLPSSIIHRFKSFNNFKFHLLAERISFVLIISMGFQLTVNLQIISKVEQISF